MDSGGDFEHVTGCIPCSFLCDCCERHCYRCSGGEAMYKWGNKYTQEIYRILCGECYYGCQQSPYKGCELHKDQHESGGEEGEYDKEDEKAERKVSVGPSGSTNFSRLPEAFSIPTSGKPFWIKFIIKPSEGQQTIEIPIIPGATEIHYGIVDDDTEKTKTIGEN